jgi:TPR repeat protein
MPAAHRGDPEAQYKLARWTENHCEQLGSVILWPCEPDVLGGFAWLEKAAAQDYPPAVYLVGVRLKHGEHVPRPPDWKGPAGNHFPHPEKGQELIDRALKLGFVPPPGDEVSYYMRVYRR